MKQEIDNDEVKKLFDFRALTLKGNNSVLSSSDSKEAFKQNQYRDHITISSILKSLKPKKNETILDFGCGIGRISSKVASKAKHVVGTDISNEMIKRAKTENQHPNITYLSNSEFLESDVKYDSIYTCWVLQHISSEKLSTLLKLLDNKLNENGKIVFLEQTVTSKSVQNRFLHQRNVSDYLDLFESFEVLKQKNVLRFPSYGLDLWNRFNFKAKYLPFFKLIEDLTVSRKPEKIEYTSTLFVLKKNKNLFRAKNTKLDQ